MASVTPAIAGAALAGASTIIGVDIDDRKLHWAKEFGATDVINSNDEDPVERIRELTDGFGVDVAIEAIGLPEVYRQCFEARDLAGNRGARRRAPPRHGTGTPVPRRVRPRRRAQNRVGTATVCRLVTSRC